MSIDQNEIDAAPLGEEEAADLRALQRAADGDPATVSAEGAEGQGGAVAPPLGQELAGMLFMLSKVVAPLLPSVGAIYTQEACDAVGAAVAPVCEKHGWLQNGVGGEWGEEIMCLVVVGPMAWATYMAASNDMQAMKDKRKAEGVKRGEVILNEGPKTAPPGALRTPGSDTVTFGPVAQ